MKKVLSVILVLCLCAGLVVGCGGNKVEKGVSTDKQSKDKKEDKKSDDKIESEVKNQNEIIDKVTNIVFREMNQIAEKEEIESPPKFDLSKTNAKDNFFTLSYLSQTGIMLDITCYADTKDISSVTVQKDKGSDIEYTNTLAEVSSLSEFEFSGDDLKEIAKMLEDQTYQIEKNGYKIFWVSSPTDMFKIVKMK